MNIIHFYSIEHKHEIRLIQKARIYDGGVAKPGQTRRTQDSSRILTQKGLHMSHPVPQGFVGSNPTPSTTIRAKCKRL